MTYPTLLKSITFTTLALIAFSANSVLCRLALGDESIDAGSFTIIRLFSGALMLFIIISIKAFLKKSTTEVENTKISNSSWTASIMLFIYALTFSFAYITLETATGALILFASVQITMILINFLSGKRLHISEWLGIGIAFSGFVYLTLPGINTPSILGSLLMTISGIAWGIYTVKGRDSQNPLADTAKNFIKTIPLVVILGLVQIFILKNTQLSNTGIMLAILSGALASGVGYSIWYSALPHLSISLAAVLQLLVPIIAAIGGILFINELITMRLLISSILILGGILFVVLGKRLSLKNNE